MSDTNPFVGNRQLNDYTADKPLTPEELLKMRELYDGIKPPATTSESENTETN